LYFLFWHCLNSSFPPISNGGAVFQKVV
jgi:hypothetical protein